MENVNKTDEAIQELTSEAKEILMNMFGITNENSNGHVERAVDCIIMASALTVAKWQSDLVSK